MQIHIGPFELFEVIGIGGMGEIWRGRHVGQNIEVALKVITRDHARKSKYLSAFRNEVQAAARLNHPNIVMLFDYGQVPVEAEEASAGRLSARSPYMVMELASLGSLASMAGPLPWLELKRTLLAILAALAHAHARGVLHRDLKAENVLVSGGTDNRPGIKLSDFGIAHALDSDTRTAATSLTRGTSELPMGTPYYMAPEQFQGQWRDYGPWTDLYSLGCLAFRLATGRLPYEGNHYELAAAHLLAPTPSLPSTVPVPEGFEDWIFRLLEKNHRYRFQRAADAAWALLHLHDVDETVHPAVCSEFHDALEKTPDTFSSVFAERVTQTCELDLRNPQLSDSSRWKPQSHYSVGISMQSHVSAASQTEHLPIQLVGAGLGLYGLRCIPLVDRTKERDFIANKLAEVRDSNRARLVLIRGKAGTGKSRLAEWMCQYAHELGVASILDAKHGPNKGPVHGLNRMIARHLRCVGLQRKEVLRRVRKALDDLGLHDDYDSNALTEILCPATEAERRCGARVVHLDVPQKRFAVIRRLLERLALQRPLIIWFDDVQWGWDSLEFCRYLLQSQPEYPTPILLLLVAQDESLAERPENELVRLLLRLDEAASLEVGALTRSDHSKLVQELLGLEGELAVKVERRTDGNPLFAVQLVGDWVQREVLQPGERGFRLKEGERAVLPDDLHQVWLARIGRILGGQEAGASTVLELAAVLGTDVDLAEWRDLCAVSGVPFSGKLLASMTMHQMMIPTEAGCRFAHNMLRESLERISRDAGRWPAQNNACAKMLEARYDERKPGLAARLGQHLLEAGELAEAVRPLLVGAAECRDTNDYRTGLVLLEDRETALSTLNVAPSDARWGAGWTLCSWLYNLSWQFDESGHWAKKAEAAARQFGWLDVLPESIWLKGWALRQQGQLGDARKLYLEALELFEQLGDATGQTKCIKALGIVSRQRGELDQAWSFYVRAQHLYEKLGDVVGVASCLYGLGSVAQMKGDEPLQAAQLLQRAMALFQGVGYHQEVAHCKNVLAEIARFSGDLDAAERGYHEVLVLQRTVGAQDTTIPELNLALVVLAKGRYAEAKQRLYKGGEAARRMGQRILISFVHAGLLACATRPFDGESWDYHLGELQAELTETSTTDPDIAGPLLLAGRNALDAEQPERARKALELARSQYRVLHNEHKVAEVEGLLARLAKDVAAGQLG